MYGTQTFANLQRYVLLRRLTPPSDEQFRKCHPNANNYKLNKNAKKYTGEEEEAIQNISGGNKFQKLTDKEWQKYDIG